MTVVADSGALYAIYDAGDSHHHEVKAVLESEPGSVVVPVAILAELDDLLLEYLGPDAELDFLDGILIGAYALEPLTNEDLSRCREILESYRDLRPGLADAAVVATAERLGVQRLLTLDERDFRVLRPRNGNPFVLLPADGGG